MFIVYNALNVLWNIVVLYCVEYVLGGIFQYVKCVVSGAFCTVCAAYVGQMFERMLFSTNNDCTPAPTLA